MNPVLQMCHLAKATRHVQVVGSCHYPGQDVCMLQYCIFFWGFPGGKIVFLLISETKIRVYLGC